MTIWALALLAVTARAAHVAPRASASSSGGGAVRAVPTVTPALGGGAGGLTLGNLDLRGTIPALPAPIPGLTQGLPAYFVPPGALGYKKVEAQTSAAPASLGDAAPVPSPAPLAAPTARGSAARRGGLIPEQPSGSLSPALLPSEGRDKAAAAGLMPALGASGASLPSDVSAADESVVGSGRGIFDNAAAKPSVDLSGFGVPSRPEMSGLNAGLSASAPRAEGARTSVPASGRGAAAADAVGSGAENDYLPASSFDAIRSPIPGAVAVVAADMRDALASPRPLDLAGAGVLGGHAPLLARPSRLALAGEGLVVRVGPAPDALLKGRGEFSRTPAPPASRAEAARRLISTELIERGALLEAVAVADAAVGRGLLGLPDGDVPGVMAGALKLKSGPEKTSPRAPAPVSGGEKALRLLGLSLLPLAAFLAARRFL